ncbi:HNH endonuclease [Streptomyces sp. NPDC058583]|uniref:HNH endonuclease n=1 Tax=unclassified Streptomyces TaxID=2593676 RepID=UPI0036589EDB
MAGAVRYRSWGSPVLKLVLHRLWDSRCYRCHRPKDFNDVQIDHIIPRDTDAQRLKKLKAEYGLPHDFDIDGPENLAPICPVCNGPRGKGNRTYGPVPVVLDQLARAHALRPRVIEQVSKFGNSTRAAEHLLRASESDLNDPRVRQAFEEHAPAIVQKLALLNEDKADFVTFRSTLVQPFYTEPREVGISLNSRGRTAEAFLEDVCGCAVDDVVSRPYADLTRKISIGIQESMANLDGPAGPIVAGPPEFVFIRTDIDSIEFERCGRSIEFAFEGNFESILTASLVQTRWDGIGLEDMQGDADVFGTFSFTATWDFSAETETLDTTECWITSWRENLRTVRHEPPGTA